jgi:hypothetical protein
VEEVEAAEDLRLLRFNIARAVKVAEDRILSNFIIGRRRPKLDNHPIPVCGQFGRRHCPPVVIAPTIAPEEINPGVSNLAGINLEGSDLRVVTNLEGINLEAINLEATNLVGPPVVTPRTLLGATAQQCPADGPCLVPERPTPPWNAAGFRLLRVARKERSVLVAIHVSKSDN